MRQRQMCIRDSYQAVCEADRWSELSEPVFAARIFPNPGVRQRLSV
mgnify:CR=1 FL=1